MLAPSLSAPVSALRLFGAIEILFFVFLGEAETAINMSQVKFTRSLRTSVVASEAKQSPNDRRLLCFARNDEGSQRLFATPEFDTGFRRQ